MLSDRRSPVPNRRFPRPSRAVPGALRRALVGATLASALAVPLPGSAVEHAALSPGGRLLTMPVQALGVLPAADVPLLERTLPQRADELAAGRALFELDWRDGEPRRHQLGPRFDASSCAACHVGVRRERRPGPVGTPVPRVTRVVAASQRQRFGAQLQRFRIEPPDVSARPAFRVEERFETRTGAFADGTPYTLRRPLPRARRVGGAASDLPTVALRTAPSLFGWGLLEAVPEQVLFAMADPTDENGDGIRGRVRMVWDRSAERPAPGRLGWKAEQPTLHQQTAAALFNDMGITTTVFPGPGCIQGASPCGPELADPALARLVTFVRYLGVPARKQPRTAAADQGEKLFSQLGCSSCHVPVLKTGPSADPALDQQTIWPYTDLLVHDLGPDLADPGGGEYARLWRTAPLWGIGKLEPFADERGFLHDGRARSLLEAILWHGGEAETARRSVEALGSRDREALIAFLRSL